MNGIVSGKSEKQVGTMVFKIKQERTALYSDFVTIRDVEKTDWVRLVRKSPQTVTYSIVDGIIPVSVIWPKSTTSEATRIYPVYNDLTYVILLFWENNILGVSTLYSSSEVEDVYASIQVGTLETL